MELIGFCWEKFGFPWYFKMLKFCKIEKILRLWIFAKWNCPKTEMGNYLLAVWRKSLKTVLHIFNVIQFNEKETEVWVFCSSHWRLFVLMAYIEYWILNIDLVSKKQFDRYIVIASYKSIYYSAYYWYDKDVRPVWSTKRLIYPCLMLKESHSLVWCFCSRSGL